MVAPSLWWEPLGQVIYEAFDYAKPVLAARSGGMPELVSDGITGYLHEPGSINALADQVMSFDAEPAHTAQMGRQGRAWLEANARIDDWLKTFCEIVAVATGRPATVLDPLEPTL